MVIAAGSIAPQVLQHRAGTVTEFGQRPDPAYLDEQAEIMMEQAELTEAARQAANRRATVGRRCLLGSGAMFFGGLAVSQASPALGVTMMVGGAVGALLSDLDSRASRTEAYFCAQDSRGYELLASRCRELAASVRQLQLQEA